MNVYIGGPKTVIISDMQGPAPDGFHVPLSSERKGLRTIMKGLGYNTGNGWRNNLHMPFAGYRDYSNASLVDQSSYGYYWLSSPASSDYPTGANNLYLYSSGVMEGSFGRATGFPIRCFKDSFETPTSSRTVITGTLGGAGIFRNQNDGLISITSDGTTGYTIQDKNLGATTVYNDGDTLTQANMGNMYQWGNNYGFPSTGSVSKTSSTQVNASTYGPGNYYNSDTFITGREDWSSVRNKNLRGGVSQGTSTKTEYQEVQNIYIGEYVPDFATRGPCPDGFHVPTKDEWDGVKTILTGLSITTVSDYSSKLHMPLAAARKFYKEIEIGTPYTSGFYWSSTYYRGGYAWHFWIYDYSGYPATNSQMVSFGMSIRPFKNTFVVPTSGWTVISGTLGSAGIFWNQTDGLISITGNGTTGYTMSDKNLGATTVRSSGDTLSEDNAGKYYQRGNNHGFPGIGNSEIFTTTTTQVNASTYGPSNYYDSSTYYYTNNINYGSWDSSNNDNLRGGVDGNVPVS